jgi:hypothetical protein
VRGAGERKAEAFADDFVVVGYEAGDLLRQCRLPRSRMIVGRIARKL